MNIIATSSLDEAVHKASRAINKIFLSEKNNILFLTSGGSALQILDCIDTENLNERITISVLDERYSNNPLVNNFLQLTNTSFFKRAQLKKCHIIDTSIEHNSIKISTEKFEQQLKAWISEYPNGKIIATFGVGEDGHTSGIMPYPDDKDFFNKMFNSDQWVVSYNAKGKNPYPLRITTTMTFLRKIDYGIVYVVGEKKRKALLSIIDEKGHLWDTPARIVRELSNVTIITNINEEI